MNKDQAYHQIALACLKALRSTPSAADPTAVVYQAIDQAFASQYSLLVTELEEAHQRLNAIAALDETRHNLSDAKAIATRHLHTH